MKKAITIMLALVILASLACANASAAVRFTDTFDTWSDFWLRTFEEPTDTYKLTEINGNSMLDMQCVVHQSKYADDDDAGVGYKNEGSVLTTGTFWIDVYSEIVSGDGGGSGIWWANTGHAIDDGLSENDTYTLKYFPATNTVEFKRDFPDAADDAEKLICKYEDPRQLGENLKSATTPVTLGMRVEPGKISAFVNGKCIASFEDPTLGSYPSPMLLWNDGGMRTCFDNFNLGDLDELKEADDTTAPDTDGKPTEAPDPDEKPTAAPDDDTTTAAPPPADTNNRAPSPSAGGAQTGDMAVVVVAVMIVALGAAIVVRKTSVK